VKVNNSVVDFIDRTVKCVLFLDFPEVNLPIFELMSHTDYSTFAEVCTIVESAKKMADYMQNRGRRCRSRFECFHPDVRL
jgi:hypothetical protein